MFQNNIVNTEEFNTLPLSPYYIIVSLWNTEFAVVNEHSCLLQLFSFHAIEQKQY